MSTAVDRNSVETGSLERATGHEVFSTVERLTGDVAALFDTALANLHLFATRDILSSPVVGASVQMMRYGEGAGHWRKHGKGQRLICHQKATASSVETMWLAREAARASKLRAKRAGQ